MWVVANIPLYLLIGRIVFGSWNGFFATMDESDWVWPRWADTKLLIFVAWVVAALAAEYYLLCQCGLF